MLLASRNGTSLGFRIDSVALDKLKVFQIRKVISNVSGFDHAVELVSAAPKMPPSSRARFAF